MAERKMSHDIRVFMREHARVCIDFGLLFVCHYHCVGSGKFALRDTAPMNVIYMFYSDKKYCGSLFRSTQRSLKTIFMLQKRDSCTLTCNTTLKNIKIARETMITSSICQRSSTLFVNTRTF